MQVKSKNNRIKIEPSRKNIRITDAQHRRIEITERDAADLMAFLYDHFSTLLIAARQEPRA